MYKVIGYLALFVTPLAPSSFFGWRVYSVVYDMTGGFYWYAVTAAAASIIGLECVGIFAGHTTLDAFRLKKYWAAGFSAVVLIAYVVIGVFELWGTIGAVIFLIAPLAYLAVGLRESLHQIDAERKQETTEKYDWRKEQLKAQLELEKAKVEANKMAAVERARIKAEAQTARKPGGEMRQDSGEMPTDWRQLTDTQKRQLALATREEREKMFPDIAARTRRQWHERLDEIATRTVGKD